MLETNAKDKETNGQLPFVRAEVDRCVVGEFDSFINQISSRVLLRGSARFRVRVQFQEHTDEFGLIVDVSQHTI
jgi:hypothetical protein